MVDMILPWVGLDEMDVFAHKGLIARLKNAGVSVEPIEHADSAFNRLKQEQFRLVLAELCVAPGDTYIDDDVRKIMLTTKNYWEVGLHLVSLVRGKGSANRDSPILVVGDSSYARLGGVAAITQACISAGANEYVCKDDSSFGDNLVMQLQRYLQKYLPR